ncbi:MAG: DinB family protein [Candidatus Thorarchaeota archaeon]
MKKDIIDERNEKELSIDFLEIAEFNLFLSLYDLKPAEIRKQVSPEINHIYWIFGHCITHMDSVFCFECQDFRIFNENELKYFGYGTKKEDIMKDEPLTYVELIDKFLELSKKTKKYLAELPAEKFRIPPEKNQSENVVEPLYSSIQRVALHIMGHMGQIIMIRRLLGNPGKSFVAGIDREQRRKNFINLENWWKENKSKYQ